MDFGLFNPNLLEQDTQVATLELSRRHLLPSPRHLLDEDQSLPTKIDEFYLKFRFYYEDPIVTTNPTATKNVFFMFREVNIITANTMFHSVCLEHPSECAHTLISKFQVKDTD